MAELELNRRSYAQYKAAFAHVPMPYAFLDMDILQSNIEDALRRSGSKQIRIASKSIRSVEVLQYILRQDARIRGVMCYSPREAVCLAERGLDDLLIGYPAWEVEAVKSAARMIAQGKTIIFMVDEWDQVQHLEKLAKLSGVVIPLCLDVDMSSDLYGIHFGVWRSPVRTVEAAVELAERIAASQYVRLDGIMGYEAQIAGIGDAAPRKALKNALIRHMKRRSIVELAAKRAHILQRLREKGIAVRFVNGGGTGSIASTCAEEAVTEVTVGSGFYSPGLFDNYQDFRNGPAAGFAIEIVRRPKPQVYTCHGGGYIGSGAAGADKLPVPYLPHGAKLLAMEGAGEVQTPLHYAGSEPLMLGDPVFMRHSKAGELCERFTVLHTYADGQVTGTMKTYRGEGWCFV